MKTLEEFGKFLDDYAKANPGIQSDDKGLLTIEYTVLLDMVIKLVSNQQEELDKASKKLNLLKDVLNL